KIISTFQMVFNLLIFPLLFTFLTFLVSWRKVKDMTVMIWRSYINFANIPGPISYPIIGAAWQFKLNIAEFAAQLLNWINVYAFVDGSVGIVKTWIGPVPYTVVVKPDYCKQLLESSTLITKGSFYDKVSEWIGTGLLTSTNEKWHGRRKMLTPAFHFNVLKGYQDTFIKQSQILMEQLEHHVETGRDVDLFPFLKRCALDIICETAMGTQINAQIGK
ncbi:hypothetical protein PENTCL1PPCAC_16311, partial [Pristionchus entomophagus]